MARKSDSSPATTVSRRCWAPPRVRRLATSGAETGAGAGLDLDESPS